MPKNANPTSSQRTRMAEQVSDPKLTTLDVKPLEALRGARDRDLQPQDQGSDAAGSHRQISRGVGEDRKRLEARSRYLERRQVRADQECPRLRAAKAIE